MTEQNGSQSKDGFSYALSTTTEKLTNNHFQKGPLYQQGLTLISVWISYYMPSKVSDELFIHPQTSTVAVVMMDVITYPSLDESYNMTVWILARNAIIFSIAAGLIRLHMTGVN